MATTGLVRDHEQHQHKGYGPRVATTLSREIRLTARLGSPLALGELGWMSTYIVDAMMIGRLPHSALSISASSLGNTIYYAIAFCVIGLLTGVETLVAQAYGRGDRKDGVRTLAQSMWLVLLGTPVVMGATLAMLPLLHRFGTPPEIAAETGRYLHPLVWSTAPLLLYMALRRYLQSIDRAMLVMVSLVSAGVVNFVGDWALLYGHLGFHAMGIAGSAWATLGVRVYMLAIVLAAVGTSLRRPGGAPVWRGLRRGLWSGLWSTLWHDLRPDLRRLRAMLRIGWPPALESFTDLGVSTYMSILCARLGTTLLAAHQVVLDLDAFVYMVPAGLAYATVVRVGQSAGRHSVPQVRRSANASLILGMGFISVAAWAFAGLPRLWGGLYTNDAAVVAAAAPIFLICGVLQLGDAAGAIFSYSLYGIGDTQTPFIVYTVWYWAIGMPLSYWLTFHEGYALRGLWTGRAVAALGSAFTLAVLWQRRLGDLEDTGNPGRIAWDRPLSAG